MTKNEHTSPEVLAIAGRGMTDPGSLSLDEIQSMSASLVTQAKDREPPTVVELLDEASRLIALAQRAL